MTALERFEHRFVPGTQENTLLLLHGTGGDESSLISLGEAVAPGWNLLSPRGNVLEGGARRFFRRFAEGVFDVEDIRRQAADLAAFVEAAASTYGFSTESLYAMGYSNGANIASSLMLLHPGRLAGAVLIRAMVPLRPDVPPDLEGVQVLMLQGLKDPLEPEGETQRLSSLLNSYGATVDLRIIEAGHELTRVDVAAATGWLAATTRQE